MRIHDISPALGGDVAPWPGDVGVRLEETARIRDGASCNVGALRTSLHNGSHADAPLHVRRGAPGVDRLPLASFVGPAVVMDRPPADLPADEVASAVPRDHRVLLRSGRSDFRRFPDDAPGIPPAWIRSLSGRGVPLVGVDLPSVDPVDSRDLPAHHACVEHGMQILENLDLRQVAPGAYTLVALPLKIREGDASPVRAVLLEGDLPAAGTRPAPGSSGAPET